MLSEAVFADAVLLVEGGSDAGALSGVADRDSGFDAYGISVVGSIRKTLLPLLWAILTELEIHVYTVFDADGGVGDRIRERHPEKSVEQLAPDIANAENEAKRLNRAMLRLNGRTEEDWPGTSVSDTYAVFADDLEHELECSWSELVMLADELASEAGARRGTRDEWYRIAAQNVPTEPPEVLRRIVVAVCALAL